jgi:hypothetical protein
MVMTHLYVAAAFYRNCARSFNNSRSNTDQVGCNSTQTLGSSNLVTAVTLHCLRRALEPRDVSRLPFVDRLLLSLIIHCSRDDDHSRAMKNLDTAFNGELGYPILRQGLSIERLSDIAEADFELPKIPSTACLTVCSRLLRSISC